MPEPMSDEMLWRIDQWLKITAGISGSEGVHAFIVALRAEVERLVAERGRERQRAEKAEADAFKLRRLLWSAHSRGMGYGDDGELQDASRDPFIDFRRNSVDEISAKLMARGIAAIKEATDGK